MVDRYSTMRRLGAAPVTLLLVLAGMLSTGRVMAESPARPAGDSSLPAGSLAADDCGAAWRVEPSPAMSGSSTTLRGIAAVSPNDVWAVGYNSNQNGSVGGAAVQHWDGSAWSFKTVPSSGTGSDRLYDVSVMSRDDVWAVGHTGNQRTMIQRWNGTAWQIVPSPNAPESINTLYGVDGITPDDVWAVGYYAGFDSRAGGGTLILHWNGSEWRRVPSPSLGGINAGILYDVHAISTDDVWAVGSTREFGSPLTLHWDGVAWSVIDLQHEAGEYSPNTFYGVAGSGPNDVWVVGSSRNHSFSRSLIERWDGSRWSVVPSPNGSLAGDNELHDVVVLAPDDAWAVGFYHDNGASGDYRTFVAHWNGSSWLTVGSPNNILYRDSRLYAVSGLSRNEIWAAGASAPSPGSAVPLVERYNDPCAPPPATTATSTPTSTPVPTCAQGWHVVAGPNPSNTGNYLSGVASVSRANAWAVGYFLDGGGVEQTLALNWDGAAWNTVPSPNAGSGNNRLTAVAALAADDVWAVGYSGGEGSRQTLVLHWQGERWEIVSSPSPGTDNTLFGLAAVSARELWAVGNTRNGGIGSSLILRWNGTTWTSMAAQVTGYNSELYSVAAVAANDVWAVGASWNGSAPDTLTMRWNGSQWNVVPSPSPGSYYEDELRGVVALHSGDVWAVGSTFGSGSVRPLTLRWNGASWDVVSSAGASWRQNSLNSVAAAGSADVWAVGSFVIGTAPTQTLALHWDNRAWGIAPSAGPQGTAGALTGVASIGSGDFWAVGHQVGADARARVLIERFVRTCPAKPTVTGTPPTATRTSPPTATRTSPPTATRTSPPTATRTSPPTATPTSPPPSTPTTIPTRTHTAIPTATSTSTPTSTHTARPVEFRDINPEDYFYSAVLYLTGRGAISGYSCGDGCLEFRPYNLTTRGQLSKIVVLAEGFPLTSDGGPHFRDVPPENPFYAYVETAYNRRLIAGYEDGTFRWANEITRGQLSKIIVLAEGWPLDTVGGPHFDDVPIASPFYSFIETAYNKGIISGYADRTFRPGNPATRGQIAKIVHGAVTQE